MGLAPVCVASLEHGSVTVGMAQQLPDDSADTLVARADAALYLQRGQQRRPT